MAALASFGFGGAVGGIATLTVSVAVPVVLVAGSFYTVANQRKLKQELILSLFLSITFQMSVVRYANITNKLKQSTFLGIFLIVLLTKCRTFR